MLTPIGIDKYLEPPIDEVFEDLTIFIETAHHVVRLYEPSAEEAKRALREYNQKDKLVGLKFLANLGNKMSAVNYDADVDAHIEDLEDMIENFLDDPDIFYEEER